MTQVKGGVQKVGYQVSHLGIDVATGMAGLSDRFQGGLGSVLDKMEHLLGGGSTPPPAKQPRGQYRGYTGIGYGGHTDPRA